MNILFFGDLVGKPAREAIKKILPTYKKKYKVDIVIANGDNLAHGRGITRKTVREITESGVDVLTCGDHIWDTKEAETMSEEKEPGILYPANFPFISHKQGSKTIKIGAVKVLVINLLGRVFFKTYPDCPFKKADEILKKNKDINIVIVDFHAEATSEKRALGFYLNSRVSAVLGTHTHIQTADEEILNGGTAYISDIGMVGPKNSVLGCRKEAVLEHMLSQKKFRYEISEDKEVTVNAVLVKIDDKEGKALSVKRINKTI